MISAHGNETKCLFIAARYIITNDITNKMLRKDMVTIIDMHIEYLTVTHFLITSQLYVQKMHTILVIHCKVCIKNYLSLVNNHMHYQYRIVSIVQSLISNDPIS